MFRDFLLDLKDDLSWDFPRLILFLVGIGLVIGGFGSMIIWGVLDGLAHTQNALLLYPLPLLMLVIVGCMTFTHALTGPWKDRFGEQLVFAGLGAFAWMAAAGVGATHIQTIEDLKSPLFWSFMILGIYGLFYMAYGLFGGLRLPGSHRINA